MATIDEEIKSNFVSDHQRAIVNILFTANWLKNIHADILKEYGISTQQYNILRILRGYNDWMPMTEVKSRMVEKSPNTTRLADKLLNSKLIDRKRSDIDRRVVYVKITDKGLEILNSVDNVKVINPTEEVFNKLSEKDARNLSALLDKLRS